MGKITAADLERIARDWQQAYQAAWHDTPPAIVWQNGWFKIENCNYRRAEIERMTAVLRSVPPQTLRSGSENGQ